MASIKRLSFNINAQAIADVPKLERILTALQPTTLLVMSDYNYALRLYDLLGGKTKICYRAYRQLNDEGTLWQNIKPAEYVASLISWGNPKIYRQVLNEPAPFPQNIIPLSDWLIEVMDRLHMAGYRGVIGNFGVGTYQPGQVDGGQFDNLLRGFDKHYDWHYFGLDEYTGVILPFGFGQWPQLALLDKNAVQPDKWPTNLPIKRIPFAAAMESARYIQDYGRYLQQIAMATDVSRQEVMVLPGYWHLLRSAWFTIRARELDLRDPQFWIREFGWDRVGDIEPIFQKLQETYGTSGFIEFGRINSLWKLFSDYYGHLGWTPQYTAYQMLASVNRVYPDNYVGMNLFSWTNAHDWKVEMGTDFADLDELHAHLIRAAQTEVPAPVPEPQPIPVPTPVPTPTEPRFTRIDGWILLLGFVLGLLAAVFLVELTRARAQEVNVVISIDQAAQVLLSAIAAIVLGIGVGGVQIPAVTPVANIIKWLMNKTGISISANTIVFAVAGIFTILIWLSRPFGFETQVNTLLGWINVIASALSSVLTVAIGDQLLHRQAQRAQVAVFGAQRADPKSVEREPQAYQER